MARRATKTSRQHTNEPVPPKQIAALASPVVSSAGGQFRIVGVGASAGGLEALTELLTHLPLDTGMGFVFVQHLDPQHPSALTELLQRATALPVREVTNNVVVEPNHVYVIPPNTDLAITGGTLTLRPRSTVRAPARSIDVFFETLAKDQRERAIGVILSGTATDGTVGLEEIKAEGGITFAQDQSARYDSMPRSAVNAGCVDFVLSPRGIAGEIAYIAKHPALAACDFTTHAEDDRLAVVAEQTEDGSPETARSGRGAYQTRRGDEGFRKTLQLLRTYSGVDFSLYKSSAIQRRVTRRVVLSRQNSIDDYAAFLRGNTAELEALYSDVLISVTSFFRNADAFNVLRRKVWPELLKRRTDEPLRVWVLGCSTGQEAYSLAMSFTEAADRSPRARELQVFATDLNDALLDNARHGLYARSIAQDLSPERLRRFFVGDAGGYRVSKALREKVVFARQNVISDPPFSRIDLISCRNLLIYFAPTLQKRVLPMLHYALRPGGYLYLGASESIGTFTELFEAVDKKHKIYQKKNASTAALQPPAERARPSAAPPPSKAAFPRARHGPREAGLEPYPRDLNATREADRITINQFAPPSVLINSDLQVLQFRGPTGAYLEPPTGKASFDVLKMVRRGLMLPLRNAIAKAKKDQKPVRREHIRIERQDETRVINVEVIPLNNLRERAFLIVFEDAASPPPATQAAVGRASNATGRHASRSHLGDESRRVSELETELSDTRDNIQSLQEEHERTSEELQASNEEIQSANEELQSINEELQTSKEELESANEELITVNQEMTSRNEELTQLNSDLINTQTSTNQAIILLARNLTIRRFSAQARKQFNLTPADIGRSFNHVRHNLTVQDLDAIIGRVIDIVVSDEREVQDREGCWWSLRIRPYLTLDNKVDGVVLVLVDINALKSSEQALRVARDYAENIIDTVREPLLVLDDRLRIENANQAFYLKFAVTPEDTTGRYIYEIGHRQWDVLKLRTLLQEILIENTTIDDYLITSVFAGLGTRTMLLSARRMHNLNSAAKRILLAIVDVTARQELERARDRLAEIVASSEDAIISTDLSGIVTSWNAGATRLFGYAVGEALGQPVEGLMPPDQPIDGVSVLERLQRNEPADRVEAVRSRKDGSLVDVLETTSPIRDHNGHVVGASTIARDITASKQLAEGLRQSDRRKDEFLAMLGHELRNPLAPILTALELMKFRGADLFTRERDVIERQVRHVSRLVDDLLDITRITQGKVSLEKSPIEIAVVIAKAIEIAEPLIDQRGHQLQLDIPQSGLVVDADSVRLSQVFANLLTNAARYTEPNGRIDIGGRREGDDVIVEIIDTGVGISPELLPHVFELFVQGSRSVDRSQGGLGLGLALVQSLVALHGGTVSASSDGLGTGTAVRVCLPLSRSTLSARLPTAIVLHDHSLNAGRRVLLVDDNAEAADILNDMLTALGFEVVVAYDGPQALVALEGFAADVAVLDIGLPVMDGYDLAQHIRTGKQGAVPRLIAMTGYGQPPDLERSRAAGFDEHLVKPVNVSALIAAMDRITAVG